MMKQAKNKQPGNDRFLQELEIASPCTASWEQMTGDEQVRFCGECQLHVYNLSGMNRDQAVALVASNEGRLCVRMLRRPDGTVLSQDCPVGLRALRKRVVAGATRCAALLGVLLTGLLACSRQQWQDRWQEIFAIGGSVDAQLIMGEVFVPESAPLPGCEAIMGRIAQPQKATEKD